jgi:hypothetical protein
MTDTKHTPELWPPADCPKLEWLEFSNHSVRMAWYQSVLAAYVALWDEDGESPWLPITAVTLNNLEQRIGCPLPPLLRQYHQNLGVLDLAETLCSANVGDVPIQRLKDAYPGFVDLAISESDSILADSLIVFSDYLGNGNMFCFHSETAAVYYFDHDTPPVLTRFFAGVEEYFDALMILCLAEVHDQDDVGEALLTERFGRKLVEKWMH